MHSRTDVQSLSAMTRLLRLPLALMVALSAVAGALAHPAQPSGTTLWALGWGVFLLAAACSVLNQVQERVTDGLMRRTCHRPLASGQLAPAAGSAIGMLLGSGGLLVLLLGNGPGPVLLGLLAMAWYLAVYTPLKRRTALAVVAGTPCGALPPLMGWLAAGGPLLAPQALALALLMILWQVPHYWLLALPDRSDLAAAGFKVLPGGLSDRQLLAVSHQWVLGLAAVTLFLPLLEIVTHSLLQGVLAGLAASLAIMSTLLLRRPFFPLRAARKLRYGLHLYLGLVFLLLLTDGLLERLF